MPPERLGEAIRQARREADVSLRELAEATGIDRGLLSRIETGKVEQPRPDKLVAIAEALDVELEDLYAAAGYTSPSGMPSLPAYLRTNYDLPLAAADRVERYLQRIKKEYEAETGEGGQS